MSVPAKPKKGIVEIVLPFALHVAVLYGLGVIFHLIFPSTGWAPWWFGAFVGQTWARYER